MAIGIVTLAVEPTILAMTHNATRTMDSKFPIKLSAAAVAVDGSDDGRRISVTTEIHFGASLA